MIESNTEKGEGKSGREIAQEMKTYIKEGREQRRESGQSRRNDKGNLLTEEVSKIP